MELILLAIFFVWYIMNAMPQLEAGIKLVANVLAIVLIILMVWWGFPIGHRGM